MGNYHPILMKIGTQTKEHRLKSKITQQKRSPNFKMAAAAILDSQVRDIKWAIITQF
jgi:hypothetical protein